MVSDTSTSITPYKVSFNYNSDSNNTSANCLEMTKIDKSGNTSNKYLVLLSDVCIVLMVFFVQ